MQLNPYEAPQTQLDTEIKQNTSSSKVTSAIAVFLLISELLLVYFGFLKHPTLMRAAFALSLAGVLFGLLKKRPWIFMIEFVVLLIVSVGLYVGTQLFILDRQEVMDSLYGNASSPR